MDKNDEKEIRWLARKLRIVAIRLEAIADDNPMTSSDGLGVVQGDLGNAEMTVRRLLEAGRKHKGSG